MLRGGCVENRMRKDQRTSLSAIQLMIVICLSRTNGHERRIPRNRDTERRFRIARWSVSYQLMSLTNAAALLSSALLLWAEPRKGGPPDRFASGNSKNILDRAGVAHAEEVPCVGERVSRARPGETAIRLLQRQPLVLLVLFAQLHL